MPEFLAIQEDLLLRIMDIIAKAGTGIAFPSQTTYLARDKPLDPQRAEEAAALVRQWRQRGELPFPDFHPDQLAHGSAEKQSPVCASPGCGGTPRERRRIPRYYLDRGAESSRRRIRRQGAGKLWRARLR